MAVEDLLEIDGGSPKLRKDAAIEELSRRIDVSASKATGVVELSVATRWPSVSLAIATELLQGVNDFNQRTRRDQAAAERKFIEGRLSVATADLRSAEDRLQAFLQANRQIRSPDLQLAQDRMQRDVSLRQQVFASLTQSYDDVRMREARDTPVVTMVDEPMVPAKPEPRGRGIRTLMGLFLGAAFGVLFTFIRDDLAKRRAAGDPAVEGFVSAVHQIKIPLRQRVARRSTR
jgi:uncharacterized protein involved in exopolysaccharide biosynthesis